LPSKHAELQQIAPSTGKSQAIQHEPCTM